MNKFLLVLAISSLFFLATVPVQAVNYTVTDLGTLGGKNSYATDINANGLVVGDSLLADGSQHAFIYHDGAMHDLGTLGGTNSEATGINSSGYIVGWSDMANGSQHAFIYREGAMHDLGTLGGSSSWASDINDNGQIVGTSNAADGSRRAFLYSSGIMQNIDTFGQFDSSAYGINNYGRIVGEYTTFIGHDVTDVYSRRAFYIGDGGMEDLGIPSFSAASAINDDGMIVGIQEPISGFVYSKGTLKSFDVVWNDINMTGQIVGSQLSRAALYSDGTVLDLNDLIEPGFEGLLEGAAGINEGGEIVGSVLYGDFLSGTKHAYLLTPIPEPSVIILLVGIITSSMGIKLARHKMRK
jgi:probable HAF family extracellular repeat protein